MKILIRLFDLDTESGQYKNYVYAQWEMPLGSPVPRVGDFVYTSPNECESLCCLGIVGRHPIKTNLRYGVDVVIHKLC